MRCRKCFENKLKLSYSHPLWRRFLLWLALCQKFRCRKCRRSQIVFLPLYWFEWLGERFQARS